MTSGAATNLDAASALARARRHRAEADAAEAVLLSDVLDWAHAHVTTDELEVATWGEAPVALAGEGSPQVTEFCVCEMATALGLSQDSGRRLMADVLELGHRLPRTWERVGTGTLRAWKARRIAEKTQTLSFDAAAWVDSQVAAFAHRVSYAALERLVDAAIAEFMPERAAEIARAAADGRFVEISHQHVSFQGTSLISGELDLRDAIDLDQVLQAGAAQLKDLGSADSLGARRSIALGALARGQEGLDLRLADEVVLHVHLAPGADLAAGVAELEDAGTHLLSVDQVRTWCGTAAKVTVKPVIDLARSITCSSYRPSDQLREQVVLRDRTCVFPHCGRRARCCDLDHGRPYDPGGPPCQTCSENLAPLCRLHHRAKTFGGWSYTVLEPGTYLWRSPHGYSYLRDCTGTRDLTPRPLEPPGKG
ncbi:MAG: HNH endonuclease [Marmoricola sp.]